MDTETAVVILAAGAEKCSVALGKIAAVLGTPLVLVSAGETDPNGVTYTTEGAQSRNVLTVATAIKAYRAAMTKGLLG